MDENEWENIRHQMEVYTEKSLVFFSLQNKIRKFCLYVVGSSWFENMILTLIALSSFKLVLDTYWLEVDSDSPESVISFYGDLFFTVVFAIEMTVKILAYGLLLAPNTYLRDSWNILDMMIVIISLIELSVSGINVASLRILRLLRTLRPLRFITHNIQMRIVVNTLFNSFIAICNVGIVIVVVWLMFAIFGVALFAGKFYECTNEEIETESRCLEQGEKWVNADSNFDNVPEAMISLFIVSSLEGWPDIMLQGVDSTYPGHAPVENATPIYAYYFIFFVVVGSFFFLNLFIGAIFESYKRANDTESSIYSLLLSPVEQRWYEIMELVGNSRPQGISGNIPKNRFRFFCYKLSNSFEFDIVILVCIFVNMIEMAIIYDEAPEEYVSTLEGINLGLTGIFMLEGAVKMSGLGFRAYFNEKWNRFDFFVIVASGTEIILSETSVSNLSILRVGPQLIRVLRVLRVTKLLKFVKSLKDVEAILETLEYSVSSIFNVFSLVMLVFFIYAILGVFLFYSVESGNEIDEFTNFFNFGNAMLTLLRISTGEEWNEVMFDCAEQSPTEAYLYFTSFQVINGFIMLNLFIMILLQGLEDHYNNPESPIDIFTETVKPFKLIWNEHAHKHGGNRLHHSLLLDFLYELGEPLGIPPEVPREKGMKMLISFKIPIEGGYVFYNDVLFSLYRHIYGRFKMSTQDKDQAKILKREEKRVLNRIKRIKEKSIKKGIIESKENLIGKDTLLLSRIMILKKVFRAWTTWLVEKKNSEESFDESFLLVPFNSSRTKRISY